MSDANPRSAMSEEALAELKVRCFTLRLHDNMLLLVPNTLVAEVIDYRHVEGVKNQPSWVSGMLSWRGRNVPLISYERMLGHEPGRGGEDRRHVILNTLNGNSRIPFVAMSIEGMPHLSMVDDTQLEYAEEDEQQPVVLAQMRHNGEWVMVPNLDVIEKLLDQLGITTA
ncbi:MAG: chemotaxis protein CheW [Thiohalomonadaceae bacterium]